MDNENEIPDDYLLADVSEITSDLFYFIQHFYLIFLLNEIKNKGGETTRLIWMSPLEVLDQFGNKAIKLAPPTWFVCL